MRNSKHKNFFRLENINDGVRKAIQAATANTVTEWMPCVRIPLDQIENLKRLNQERIAQTCNLRVVLRDCFVQFKLG